MTRTAIFLFTNGNSTYMRLIVILNKGVIMILTEIEKQITKNPHKPHSKKEQKL